MPKRPASTAGDSLIYIGGAIAADEITYVDARLTDTKARANRYTVDIFTDDETRTVDVLPENVETIKRLIGQFRSADLPGVPFSVDSKKTTVTGNGEPSGQQHIKHNFKS